MTDPSNEAKGSVIIGTHVPVSFLISSLSLPTLWSYVPNRLHSRVCHYYRRFSAPATKTTKFYSPMIGGSLSQPAKKFPAYFDTPFFHAFPYFLPCFVASLITLLSILVGYWHLKEVSCAEHHSHQTLTDESIFSRHIPS